MMSKLSKSLWGTFPTKPQNPTMPRLAPIPVLIAALREYLRHRRDQQLLESLPDHLLEDVGLSRADIRWHGRGLRLVASLRRFAQARS